MVPLDGEGPHALAARTLEQTLGQGLRELFRPKPDNPVEWLGRWLLSHEPTASPEVTRTEAEEVAAFVAQLRDPDAKVRLATLDSLASFNPALLAQYAGVDIVAMLKDPYTESAEPRATESDYCGRVHPVRVAAMEVLDVFEVAQLAKHADAIAETLDVNRNGLASSLGTNAMEPVRYKAVILLGKLPASEFAPYEQLMVRRAKDAHESNRIQLAARDVLGAKGWEITYTREDGLRMVPPPPSLTGQTLVWENSRLLATEVDFEMLKRYVIRRSQADV